MSLPDPQPWKVSSCQHADKDWNGVCRECGYLILEKLAACSPENPCGKRKYWGACGHVWPGEEESI